MDIYLKATSVLESTSINEMKIVKIRGCNRNEDCVYFDKNSYLVYVIGAKLVKDDRRNFIDDLITLFKTHFSVENAGTIYDFIAENHLKVKADAVKSVKEYAKTEAEELALLVLRKEPYCNYSEFKSLAFDFMIEHNYSKTTFTEALNNYASM